jgi:DNA helicase-2/ATP-dependent DNA helicase PcrA
MNLNELNEQQSKAVKYKKKEPLLVIAGAGTGKTKTITTRIGYLIKKKLAEPSQILALTFTDKAADEMEQRVDILVDYGLIDTWISTFHSFGDRILREEAISAGLDPEFKVLTKPEQIMFFRDNLFEFKLNILRPTTNPTKHIESLINLFSRAKDENVSEKKYLEYANNLLNNSKDKAQKHEAKIQKEIALAYSKYEELKKENGLLDFSDQVYLTYHLLKNNSKLLKKYQDQFKYILVDEFQDTNHIQYLLIKLLTGEKNRLTVVGDDDQSIYKFRGASLSNILEFKKDFPKLNQIILNKNYRSTQEILDKAYQLIKQNNPDRLEIKNQISKKLLSQTKKGVSPKLKVFSTIDDEADFITREIKNLVKKKETSYKDIAILVRANSQAEEYIRSLNKEGVPWTFSGQSGLYQYQEIKLLTSFLRSLASNRDNLSLYHLASSDIYDIGNNDLIDCFDEAKKSNNNLYQVLKSQLENNSCNISEEGLEKIEKLIEDIDHYRELAKEKPAGQVLYQFLDDKKILENLTEEESIESELKIKNIASFFGRIQDFEKVVANNKVVDLIGYLDSIIEAGDDPESKDFDPDLDAVSILTVHSAKGLEFENVFLASLASDRFPTRRRSAPLELPEEFIQETLPEGDFHVQEERRLFYVAITRAKKNLYLSFAYNCGGVREKKPSPFIAETMGSKILSEAQEKIKNQSQAEKNAKQIKLFGSQKKSTQPAQAKLKHKETLFLSSYKIDDYLTCPLKYKYVNVLKLPVMRKFQIAFGSAIHNSIEKFLKAKQSGKDMTLKKLLVIFENYWQAEGFDSLEHQKEAHQDGRDYLTKFFRQEKNLPAPETIEEEFAIKFGNNQIKGRWDVSYIQDQKIQLVDFKTSTVYEEKKAKEKVYRSLQLDLYSWGYLTKYGQLPDQVGLYFLGSSKKTFKKPSDKNIKKIKKKIKEVERGIRNNDFRASPDQYNCQYCAYSKICPYAYGSKE